MRPKRKKRGLAFLPALCLLLLLISCTADGSAPSADAYLKGSHRVRAAWEIGGVCYEGVIAVSDGLGVRDGEILYTAPTALAGVRVTRVGEHVTFSLSDATWTGGEELAAAAKALDFFRIGGGVTLCSESGRRVLLRGEDRLTVCEEYAP